MSTEQKNSKILNIVLWVVQGLLAFLFVWAGYSKLLHPDQVPYPWAKDQPSLVPVTGIVDVLGGLGLILPMLLNIRPKLTVYAAYGIVALMVVAMVLHISRGEANVIGFNVVILALAGFVAWGRQRGNAA
jgi:uncharacterized membrane protein